jgi:predicted transposase/invertase (TIGR01784 family)
MSNEIHQAHDKRYKELLSNKRTFIDLLKSCVGGPWTEQLTEDNLVKVDKSYILQDFEKKESDLVYRVVLGEQQVVFYVLLELQSTVDNLMPYRLLEYMLEIWRDFFKNTPQEGTKSQDFRLPAIMPIVVYNGPSSWSVPTKFKEIISQYQRFGEYLVDFKYALIDIHRYTEDDLKKFSKLLAVVFHLEQAKDEEDLIERVKQWVGVIKSLGRDEYRQLIPWLRILSYGMGKNREKLEQYIENPEEVETMINFAEEEIKKKHQQLKLEGKREGKLEDAQAMLNEGMDYEKVKKITGLTDEELKTLKH